MDNFECCKTLLQTCCRVSENCNMLSKFPSMSQKTMKCHKLATKF